MVTEGFFLPQFATQPALSNEMPQIMAAFRTHVRLSSGYPR